MSTSAVFSKSVSITKGIGISLMVIGHSGCPAFLDHFIYMFHMPLFFIISGYCFHSKYVYDKTTFIRKRIKGLYFPYVKYSLLFLALHNILFDFHLYESTDRGGYINTYKSADYIFQAKNIITRMYCEDQLIGGYWFIRELFFGSLIFFTLKYFIRRPMAICIGLLLAVLVAKLSPYIRVPYFNLNWLTFFAAFFIAIGHFINQKNINLSGQTYVLAFVIVALASIYIPTGMPNCPIGLIVPYALCAILGTLTVMYISNKLSASNLPNLTNSLVYIGSHTLEILTWHFLSFKIVSLIVIYTYNLPIEELGSFPVINHLPNNSPATDFLWLIYTLVGIGVPILGCLTLERINKLIQAKKAVE